MLSSKSCYTIRPAGESQREKCVWQHLLAQELPEPEYPIHTISDEWHDIRNGFKGGGREQ
jgi:hypothetical protein